MIRWHFIQAIVTATGLLLAISAPAVAAAAPLNIKNVASAKSQTGNDVSWPQCGTSLPTGQLFGIVGVNGGLANNTNQCFSSEVAWAAKSAGGTGQAKVALYANTANPGNLGVADWPKTGTSVKYGTCHGADDKACAYQYGWTLARLDATSRGVVASSTYKWWLDVETDNSWESDTANNVADLEGMVDYFQGVGAHVGLYSTASQWKQIAGSVSSRSSLAGLDSWLPGASGLTVAKKNCSLPGLTGGRVTLTQYVAGQTDYDFSCI